MYTKNNVAMKTVEIENSHTFLLKYFITERPFETDDSLNNVYGIEIEKYLLTEEHEELVESECINDITLNYEEIKRLQDKLSTYLVTPITLCAIMDDYIE